MKVKAKANLDGTISMLEKGNKKLKFEVASQVLKDSNFYIPKDRGALEASSLIHSDLEAGIIKWATPYARRLYWNPQYNFSHDVNPNARGLWFEAAKAERMSDWIRKGAEAYFE